MAKFIANDEVEIKYEADFVFFNGSKVHMPNKMYLDKNTGIVYYGAQSGPNLKCKDPFNVGTFMFYVYINPPENGLKEILTLLYCYMRDNKK